MAADGLALLAEWRRQAAENRRIAAFLGMAGWKQAAIAAAFAHAGPPAPFAATEATALALARAAQARGEAGAIAVWATRAAPGLAARCAAAGIPLLWVEDGFLRSVGLGSDFIPSASLAVDGLGLHYDPATPSGLERILAEAKFPPALLARAAALRAAIVARGLPSTIWAGRPRRCRVRLAGAASWCPARSRTTPRSNAVPGRSAPTSGCWRRCGGPSRRPSWCSAPHPDVETGYRRGTSPRRAALRFADAVVAGGDIGGLFAQVEAVHAITSLAGFEALLRGLAVTTWGRPFYAGWGLTTDRAPPPRRGRALSLDALVAGALIRYPRYLDPLTQLPCGPEVLLERLAEPAAWPQLSAGRRAWVPWWRHAGWWLKQCRRFGVWRR